MYHGNGCLQILIIGRSSTTLIIRSNANPVYYASLSKVNKLM
jgi:hypothetical protein